VKSLEREMLPNLSKQLGKERGRSGEALLLIRKFTVRGAGPLSNREGLDRDSLDWICHLRVACMTDLRSWKRREDEGKEKDQGVYFDFFFLLVGGDGHVKNRMRKKWGTISIKIKQGGGVRADSVGPARGRR